MRIRVRPLRSRSQEYHHMLVEKEPDVAIRHCNLKNDKGNDYPVIPKTARSLWKILVEISMCSNLYIGKYLH